MRLITHALLLMSGQTPRGPAPLIIAVRARQGGMLQYPLAPDKARPAAVRGA